MKVSRDKWKQATQNLIDRRKAWGHPDDNRKLDNPVRDYKLHLMKCGVGSSVLDVGCGSQFLKTCLPEGVQYFGLDAFPIEGLDVIPGEIETLEGIEVDTVCAFAVLDNCRSFWEACASMKKAARKNIIILTGLGIDPDQFHTFRLERNHFDIAFHDWHCTHEEQLIPKVWLFNFQKLA